MHPLYHPAMTSIPCTKPSRRHEITNYEIYVEWGEPLRNALRRQRFTSFLNAVPNPLLWDISLPGHSKSTFSARLRTVLVELFLTNKEFIDTLEKNNILPFSRVVFSPIGIEQYPPTPRSIQSPTVFPLIFPSDDEKAVEVTFADGSSIIYRCGMISYAIDKSLTTHENMNTIHKLHHHWLKAQPHVNWEDYSDLTQTYRRDKSMTKVTREQICCCLQSKLLSFVISQYRVSITTPQRISARKIQKFMNVVHLSHMEWIQNEEMIEDCVFDHYSHVYKSDPFLEEPMHIKLSCILQEKNHNFYLGHRQIIESLSDSLNCSPYSHNAEELFKPLDSLEDLHRWEALEEAKTY